MKIIPRPLTLMALTVPTILTAVLAYVIFYPKDRAPQHGTVTNVTFTNANITFGSRTMSVKEFKAEHERLAGYIVNLLITLRTNHVVIDGRSPGITSTNWQLRIMENPENTNQMTVSYEL